ncbi:MAG TPA: ABC transporter substrate-binding protein [Nonomuraea sp.]|nr:ABC transporter substrate-binding protein [Nonomuraea sp.]
MPATGRGYDASTLYLGFPTNNDVNDSAKNLGLAALNFGDIPAQIKAVVDDVNKRGGVLGRKVVPVLHDIKTASLQNDPNGEAQATCSAFTEDHKVVAVVNVVAGIDLQSFYACLAKHDTPLVSAGFTPVDDAFMASFSPYLYKLTSASFSSLTPVWIARLAAQRYFNGWNPSTGGAGPGPAKIGLLYPSVQPQQRIFASIHQQLTRRGYDVVKEFQYSVASLDQESSSMAGAVLAFNSAGVTHVLSSEADALLFMTAAENQHYRPRYGLTSYHAPAAALQGTVPAAQLIGSMGVGWLPVSDVDSTNNPGTVGPGETTCRKIMKDHGVDISSAGAATVAFGECDGIHLLIGAVTTQHDASSRGVRLGVGRIGPSFASALVRQSGFSANRAVMPGAVRDFAYDGSAYRYTSTTDYRL